MNIPGERGARPAGLLGARELPLIAVVASFLVAVLLGVGIGLATADRGGGSDGATIAGDAPARELSPPLGTVPWSANRQPGQANQMFVTDEPDPTALRLALQWTVSDRIRQQGGDAKITASQVTVPNGMFFGAIQGADADHDEYWAVGRADVSGLANPPPNPYVWRRVGSTPWTIVRNGAGACSSIPGPLLTVWKGQPAPCSES